MSTIQPFLAPGAQMPDGDDDPALTAPADRTLKSDLLAELRRKSQPKIVTYTVPDRPGWSVDFDAKSDADLMKMWAKEATDRDGLVDPFYLSLLVIAGQCRAIKHDGKVVEDDGQTVTFASRFMAEAFETPVVTEIVRLFYANDNAVATVFAKLSEDGQVGSLDPTTASSS